MTSSVVKIVYEFYSSDIKKAEYSIDSYTLTVTFNNNWKYSYYNVPLSIIKNWLEATSIGQYFNEEIKKKGFQFERRV